MCDTVHIQTKSGFEADVTDNKADDAALLAACVELQAGVDMLAVPKILRLLLPAKDRTALFNHVRAPGGRVPCEALAAEVVDIMEQLAGQKKIIALAGMLATDEDALVCDLAETYHIHDWRALPVRTVATLACGLSDDSRIKMRLSGAKAPTSTVLSAAMIDRLSLLWWGQTKDAQKGRNRPKMLMDVLTPSNSDPDAPDTEAITYASLEDFQAARKKLLQGGGLNGN